MCAASFQRRCTNSDIPYGERDATPRLPPGDCRFPHTSSRGQRCNSKHASVPQVSTRCSVPAKESQAQAKHERRLTLHCATVGSSGSWGSATGAVDRCLSVPEACGSCRSKSSLKEVPPRYLTLTARDSYTSTVELHVVGTCRYVRACIIVSRGQN